MTGSPHGHAHRRDTGTDERHNHTTTHTPGAAHPHPFSATHIMRRPAPASRPSGRYAVGLRPSLDPDASNRRAHNQAKKNKNGQHSPLTGPAPSGMTSQLIEQRHIGIDTGPLGVPPDPVVIDQSVR